MKDSVKDRYESRAKIIKAMAHPSRLIIIDQLAVKERTVQELTDKVEADMSTVSKHLSVLKNSGIIQSEKRGLNVYYSLKVPCIMNFFGCVEEVIKASMKLHQVALKR